MTALRKDDYRDKDRMASFIRVDMLVERFVERVMEHLYEREDIYGKDIRPVENKSRDGFIPYTDGGWDGIGYQTLGYCYGSGSAPAMIQPYIDSSIKQAEEDWNMENPEHQVEWIYDEEANDNDRKQLSFLKGYNPTPRDTWREKWYEFQDRYMEEGSTFFYKVRVLYYDTDSHRNTTGEPEALFFVGINTDFEYGRDNIPWLACYGAKTQQSEWLWEKNVPVSEINVELINQYVEEACKAFDDA